MTASLAPQGERRPRRLSSAPSIASHEFGLLQDMAAHGVFHLPTASTAWQTQRGHIQGIQAEHIAVLAATGWRAGPCIPLVMQVVSPGDADGRLLCGQTFCRARNIEQYPMGHGAVRGIEVLHEEHEAACLWWHMTPLQCRRSIRAIRRMNSRNRAPLHEIWT